MKNKYDIIFASGEKIEAGRLEFLGHINTKDGDVIYEFRETCRNDTVPVCTLFEEMVRCAFLNGKENV